MIRTRLPHILTRLHPWHGRCGAWGSRRPTSRWRATRRASTALTTLSVVRQLTTWCICTLTAATATAGWSAALEWPSVGHQLSIFCLNHDAAAEPMLCFSRPTFVCAGDRPFLISGADDRVAKVWDYQTKACVQTLEGHAHNVSAVMFHPELPVRLPPRQPLAPQCCSCGCTRCA